MILGLPGVGIVPLLLLAFWIWMLVDCASNQKLQGSEKVLWLLLIIFTAALGAIIYFFAGRSNRGQQTQGRPQAQGFYQPYQPMPYQPDGPKPYQLDGPKPYQPYEQGYSQPRPLDLPNIQQNYGEQPSYEQYEQYEQPQASYPEQMQGPLQ